MQFLKSAFYRASRSLEGVLPLGALWLLMWPVSALVAARHMRVKRERVPSSSLPAASVREPSAWARWRYLTKFQEHWWLLGWLDRLTETRWQRRLTVQGVEHLRAAIRDRPVVVVTLHTTSMVTLAAWIRSLGIVTAAAPADQSWFSSAARRRKVELAESLGAAVFRTGSARDVLGYLVPGRCIVLTLDHESRRAVFVEAPGASLRVATDAFRLARAAGAAVVPALITRTGPWRYDALICRRCPNR